MKPAHFAKHPCDGCDTGYIECAQGLAFGLKCCPDCNHPGRWEADPYTSDEIAQMKAYHAARYPKVSADD
jgi:hypothetical protein